MSLPDGTGNARSRPGGSLGANCGARATASDENKGPYTDAQGKRIAATQAATSMLKAL
jgi:hypothetical protein